MCTVLLRTSCSWNWLQGSRSHCNFGSNRQPADRDQHSENKFISDVIQTHRKTLLAGFRQKLPLFWNPKNRDNPSDLIEKGSVSWEGATEELSACDVQHIAVKSGPECDVRCALACIKAYLRLQTFWGGSPSLQIGSSISCHDAQSRHKSGLKFRRLHFDAQYHYQKPLLQGSFAALASSIAWAAASFRARPLASNSTHTRTVGTCKASVTVGPCDPSFSRCHLLLSAIAISQYDSVVVSNFSLL